MNGYIIVSEKEKTNIAQNKISLKDIKQSFFNGSSSIGRIRESKVARIIQSIYEREFGEKATLFVPLDAAKAIKKWTKKEREDYSKVKMLNRGLLFLNWLEKLC